MAAADHARACADAAPPRSNLWARRAALALVAYAGSVVSPFVLSLMTFNLPQVYPLKKAAKEGGCQRSVAEHAFNPFLPWNFWLHPSQRLAELRVSDKSLAQPQCIARLIQEFDATARPAAVVVEDASGNVRYFIRRH